VIVPGGLNAARATKFYLDCKGSIIEIAQAERGVMRIFVIDGFVTHALASELQTLAKRHGVSIRLINSMDIRLDEVLSQHIPNIKPGAINVLYKHNITTLSHLAQFSFEGFMRIVCRKKLPEWDGAYTVTILELMAKYGVSFTDVNPRLLLKHDIDPRHMSTRSFNSLRSNGVVSYAMLHLLSNTFLIGNMKNFGDRALGEVRRAQSRWS